MGKCSIPFCEGNATFTFPKEEKRCNLWERAISENFQAMKSSRLYASHFEKDQLIVNHESYYTGVLSSKKYLKSTAISTLRLKLGMEKSKRSEKIRKSLFKEDSSSSSLSLSLLDYSAVNGENFGTKSEEVLKASSIAHKSPRSECNHSSFKLINPNVEDACRKSPSPQHSLSLSNMHKGGNDIEIIVREETDASVKFIFQETIVNNQATLRTDFTDLNDLDIQAEETIVSPTLENKEAEKLIENKKNFYAEKRKFKGKTFKSKGVQAGRGFISVTSICHRDNVVHYFTGLENYKKFCFVYQTLKSFVNGIQYTKVQVNCIAPEDMFLLTLTKLRRNIPDLGLSIYFGISESLVSNIFHTWIHFIYQLWSLLDTWSSREVVDIFMPQGFKKSYPSTRVIVDATEIPIAKPSNPMAQQCTFSTYKNRNTVKVLVGATPGGLLSYNSDAYGGSTSDRQIVERSYLVQQCQAGDSIMADRGFNVDDICQSHELMVNIPHFLRGKQLPGLTVLSDRKLASKRVHIERLIGLTKTYKILREPLNPSYVRLSSKIFSICLMLCNFRECIVSQQA